MTFIVGSLGVTVAGEAPSLAVLAVPAGPGVGVAGKRRSSASSSANPGVATVLHAPLAVLAVLCGVLPLSSVLPEINASTSASSAFPVLLLLLLLLLLVLLEDAAFGNEREVSILGRFALPDPPRGEGRGEGRASAANAGEE